MKRNVLILLILFVLASVLVFSGALLRLEEGASVLSKGLMGGAIVLFFVLLAGLGWMIFRWVAK